MTPTPPISMIPRATAIDGPTLAKLLLDWIQRPTLKVATLVTFAFDPRFRWWAEPSSEGRVIGALERAASACRVRIVTDLWQITGTESIQQEKRRSLERLQRAGAEVLVHHAVHAKVYLLEDETRVCWVVGSSNLTAGGLRENCEINMRGFHPDDYRQVRHTVESIVSSSRPI